MWERKLFNPRRVFFLETYCENFRKPEIGRERKKKRKEKHPAAHFSIQCIQQIQWRPWTGSMSCDWGRFSSTDPTLMRQPTGYEIKHEGERAEMRYGSLTRYKWISWRQSLQVVSLFADLWEYPEYAIQGPVVCRTSQSTSIECRCLDSGRSKLLNTRHALEKPPWKSPH